MGAEALEATALWLAGAGRPELRHEVVGAPGPGEVRIRALASAISQGTEMLVYRGQVPAGLPLDLPTLAGSFAYPIKYGYALAGQVLDVGAGVNGLAEGDTVFALHPHQSIARAPADVVTRLPDGFDPRLGVFTANLETALNIVHDTPLLLGETAVIFGMGSVGLLALQLLRLAGAGQIIAIDPLTRRREMAWSLGADAVLEPDLPVAERVRALTGGRGADVAVEVSGAGLALQAAIESVTTEGTVVVASWYGTKAVTLELGGHFHRGRVRLRSSQVGTIAPERAGRWDFRRRMETVVGLLPKLRLSELITHAIPLADAAEAYRLIDERPDEVIQVVLVYDA
jgi:2-desacetyl-2-hydroxyethyl bacteriochlorophyllide A dehydrogenase